MAAMTDREYARERGLLCPNCRAKSTAITLDIEIVNPDEARMGLRCNNCGARWEEIYKLIGYEGLEVRVPHEAKCADDDAPTEGT
jgi:transcription elongation factor Elf1